MGRKNNLKVNLNAPATPITTIPTTATSINTTITATGAIKIIDPLKNLPELLNKPALEMAKLLSMSEKDNKNDLDPIELYNQQENAMDDDEDDDKMGDDNDSESDEDNTKKKLTHKEKFLLKRKIKSEVTDLKQQRRKCKKTNFVQKKEKKIISKEIHEKINATLKKKKN